MSRERHLTDTTKDRGKENEKDKRENGSVVSEGRDILRVICLEATGVLCRL